MVSPLQTTDATPDTGPSRRRVTAIVLVLSLAIFMSSLDLFIVNLAFPYIGREYTGTSLSSLSWVLNGYAIVFAAVLVPAGRWGDRVGRRRLFVAGLATFTVASLLCGVSPGVPELIAARLLQAVGAGLMVPASLSLLLASVPAPLRAQAIGSWSGVRRPGRGAGPGHRRQPGAAQLALGVLDQPAGRGGRHRAGQAGRPREQGRERPGPTGPAGRRPAGGCGRPHRPGPRGGALLGVGLWPASWGVLVASVASGAAVVLRSQRHHSPVIELSLLRSRTLQRRLHRLDPLLRRIRRLAAQPGGVPDRRLALLRRAGRTRHRAGAPHGAAVRPGGQPRAWRRASAARAGWP